MESKQSITNLGYPEIIAKLFFQRFGDNAFLISRWYKETKIRGGDDANWWENLPNYSSGLSVPELVKLYYAALDGPETYLRMVTYFDVERSYGHEPGERADEDFMARAKQMLRAQVETAFFKDTFFSHWPIIKDIETGKLKDIAPYKQLPFAEAEKKYEDKRLFSDATPIKVYKDGFKWIDVGKKCPLVGGIMKNCGSVSVMSLDADATMITLFGPGNKPHVIVTYSPKNNTISGDEGGASSAVKTEYHKYILDLVKTIGANFSYDKSKSKLLKMKYLLKDKAKNVRETKAGLFDSLFQFTIDGKVWYSDGYMALSKDEVARAQDAIKRKLVILPARSTGTVLPLFNYRNQDILKSYGLQYIPVNQLAGGNR